MDSMSRSPTIEIRQHQWLVGNTLYQSIELRRSGGGAWQAYSRVTALPPDAEPRARLLYGAGSVLGLATAAIAAVEAAREARSSDLNKAGPSGVSYSTTSQLPHALARSYSCGSI